MNDSGTRRRFKSGAERDGATGKGMYDCLQHEAIRRLALVCEKGAEKYNKYNCKKGMPLSQYFDSALRHLFKAVARHTDEDHLAMAMWNIAEAIELVYRIECGNLPPSLDDVPDFYVHATDMPTDTGRFSGTCYPINFDAVTDGDIVLNAGIDNDTNRVFIGSNSEAGNVLENMNTAMREA